MKVLWLGQSGLLFVCGKRKVMIDPYLTNSLCLIDYTLDRKMKVNKKIFSVRPDVIVLTNCHPDHADVDTVSKFAKKQKSKLTILSSESVFLDIADHEHCAKANNIMFEPGSEWSIEGLTIQAVLAKTDDKSAIGVVITDTKDGKKYYIAGDTLYNKYVLQDLPSDIFACFVPINGEYGSMNVIDAKRFAVATGAKYVVPVHFGMFDKIDPLSFNLENAIIPKIYRIIDFESDCSTKDKKLIDRKFNERPVQEPVTTVETTVEANKIEEQNEYSEAVTTVEADEFVSENVEIIEVDESVNQNIEAVEIDEPTAEDVENISDTDVEADEVVEADEITESAEIEETTEIVKAEDVEEITEVIEATTEAVDEESKAIQDNAEAYIEEYDEPEVEICEALEETEEAECFENDAEMEDVSAENSSLEEAQEIDEEDSECEEEFDIPLYDDFDDEDDN